MNNDGDDTIRDGIFREIVQERERQEELRATGKFLWTCSDPGINNAKKLAVLAEEVAELFEAVRMRHGQFKDGRDDAHPFLRRQDCIRAEAIQVAAVALRIAEQAGRVTR